MFQPYLGFDDHVGGSAGAAGAFDTADLLNVFGAEAGFEPRLDCSN
jgi:hypothetical protein